MISSTYDYTLSGSDSSVDLFRLIQYISYVITNYSWFTTLFNQLIEKMNQENGNLELEVSRLQQENVTPFKSEDCYYCFLRLT